MKARARQNVMSSNPYEHVVIVGCPLWEKVFSTFWCNNIFFIFKNIFMNG
jgi:hypothetical protein